MWEEWSIDTLDNDGIVWDSTARRYVYRDDVESKRCIDCGADLLPSDPDVCELCDLHRPTMTRGCGEAHAGECTSEFPYN